jgi:elongation factor G
VNGHRGQVLGYEAKANWRGWDEVQAHLPQAEMQTLIVELRSLTMGVGTFRWQFDHLQEVPEKVAEKLLAESRQS